jgi:hypothetical protein
VDELRRPRQRTGSGQCQLELIALHIDYLRDRHVDVAAIEQKVRVDERDPDDVAVGVNPTRASNWRSMTCVS